MTKGPARTELTLTADEARRIQLRAQGLLGAEGRRGGVAGVLRRLGAVQLDTISVLARSHELVAYARLGPVGREAVESAYWGNGTERQARTFEYWAHAACVLPADDWPYFAFRRRAFRARDRDWRRVSDHTFHEVLARLHTEGPMTATELGGAKRGGPWWDWSDVKVAVERLLAMGEVICVRRVGWRRVYDLPERALPGELLHDDLDDTTCHIQLLRQAGSALGVATRGDLADYYRLRGRDVDAALPETGLVPVAVVGWRDIAYADPCALTEPFRGRHRTTLLSPFDSLLWQRMRTERVFGFNHRLEAYVPRQQRVHGYFTMPVLTKGGLVGRVDPAREGKTLVARRVSLVPTRGGGVPASTVAATAESLREAAAWVGCDNVRVELVDPPELSGVLEKLIS